MIAEIRLSTGKALAKHCLGNLLSLTSRRADDQQNTLQVDMEHL